MKRNIAVIACIILLSVGSLKAKPIDENYARTLATTFLHAIGYDNAPEDMVNITSETDYTEFYLFSINSGRGFIIVAGDDNSNPILGYSLRNAFPVENIPPHVDAWMKNYEKEIRHNRENPLKKGYTIEQITRPEDKAGVEPLLTTIWNQSPFYNIYCPYDEENNGLSAAGCTATATAQIMKYFNYPATGYGSKTFMHSRLGELSADYGATTYMWDDMPIALSDTSTEAQVDAIATLIYQIGVAVDMNYSAQGSGGKTASYGYGGEASSENALKYNFKYSPYVWTAFIIDYNYNGWKNLMKQELNNGRPILYAGYDKVQSGHAFVCDGYNIYGQFHMNWGWGGAYDGNYMLNNLNPASPELGISRYHFDLFSTATVGIEPYDGWDENGSTTVSVTAESIDGAPDNAGRVTGAGTYNFGDTITMTATASSELYRFVQWSDGCKYNPRITVATGGEVSFTAQFAPVQSNTLHYHTCDNAMNRASNIPAGLGCDSVWGIKIPSSVIAAGSVLNSVRFMGHKSGTYTLSIWSGVAAPDQMLYNELVDGTLDYDYTFLQHDLTTPIETDNSQSLWIMLKCTDVDTPGVFSIYGGNPNSLLIGEDMACRGDELKFSWMIEALFDGNNYTPPVAINDVNDFGEISIYPNPADDNITISLREINNQAIVRILDINGKCLIEQSIHELTSIINTQNLASGVYVVQLSNGKNSYVQKLVIK